MKVTTIKDIAKLAGVSSATVSRILNGKGEASEETIQRVNKIAEELNYTPNSLAKALSKGKTNVLALLIPNLNNPFFGELVEVISTVAQREGYEIYLCNSNDKRENVEFYLQSIAANYACGAIISSLQVTKVDLVQLEKRGVHTITIDRAHFEHPYSSLTVDHEKGGYLATNHLLKDANCRRIVYLSGPIADDIAGMRLNGYKKALEEYNCELDKSLILNGSLNFESGYRAMEAFFKRDIAFDGLFCANDIMAHGAIRAIQDAGLSVPKDIKVVGYDNLTMDKYSNPRLSSVTQHMDKAAETVIKELKRLNEQNKIPKSYVADPGLIIRESSKET